LYVGIERTAGVHNGREDYEDDEEGRTGNDTDSPIVEKRVIR
jgi:hypothetical protein